jgi:hypothetical protein
MSIKIRVQRRGALIASEPTTKAVNESYLSWITSSFDGRLLLQASNRQQRLIVQACHVSVALDLPSAAGSLSGRFK